MTSSLEFDGNSLLHKNTRLAAALAESEKKLPSSKSLSTSVKVDSNGYNGSGGEKNGNGGNSCPPMLTSWICEGMDTVKKDLTSLKVERSFVLDCGQFQDTSTPPTPISVRRGRPPKAAKQSSARQATMDALRRTLSDAASASSATASSVTERPSPSNGSQRLNGCDRSSMNRFVPIAPGDSVSTVKIPDSERRRLLPRSETVPPLPSAHLQQAPISFRKRRRDETSNGSASSNFKTALNINVLNDRPAVTATESAKKNSTEVPMLSSRESLGKRRCTQRPRVEETTYFSDDSDGSDGSESSLSEESVETPRKASIGSAAATADTPAITPSITPSSPTVGMADSRTADSQHNGEISPAPSLPLNSLLVLSQPTSQCLTSLVLAAELYQSLSDNAGQTKIAASSPVVVSSSAGQLAGSPMASSLSSFSALPYETTSSMNDLNCGQNSTVSQTTLQALRASLGKRTSPILRTTGGLIDGNDTAVASSHNVPIAPRPTGLQSLYGCAHCCFVSDDSDVIGRHVIHLHNGGVKCALTRRYLCDQCPERVVFQSQRGLLVHVRTVHRMNFIKVYIAKCTAGGDPSNPSNPLNPLNPLNPSSQVSTLQPSPLVAVAPGPVPVKSASCFSCHLCKESFTDLVLLKLHCLQKHAMTGNNRT